MVQKQKSCVGFCISDELVMQLTKRLGWNDPVGLAGGGASCSACPATGAAWMCCCFFFETEVKNLSESIN
jgi:hypothetical protein